LSSTPRVGQNVKDPRSIAHGTRLEHRFLDLRTAALTQWWSTGADRAAADSKRATDAKRSGMTDRIAPYGDLKRRNTFVLCRRSEKAVASTTTASASAIHHALPFDSGPPATQSPIGSAQSGDSLRLESAIGMTSRMR